ncbi:shikimate kinase [Pseudoclavibacter chungangensis]|uniref:Shikimate kinase n=1 Tax=Pseudoclavibacter chungangensis TaxID=587635 RepID=A0A7J5BU38_9MICO|nr:shikimate kinase [Pseudoclavibacter chungangensis]KAB1657858.1 shikimate kinase [Pseudoclavibacter chungangensis]NYJ66541.1 shikimate kinase [Pseudoclavibacter chungangensis]
MSIVLIGPPAAGKTRGGRRLARRLDVEFVDTDRVIVSRHGPIPDVFASHGESGFRAIEREVVAEALDGGGVVSLGGGAVMDPDTQRLLPPHTVIQLVASPAAIERRIRGSTKRPLIRSIDDWQRLYDARRETYERLATVTFDTSHGTMAAVVADIEQWVRAHREEDER